jgi:hypothetical protein
MPFNRFVPMATAPNAVERGHACTVIRVALVWAFAPGESFEGGHVPCQDSYLFI